MGSSTFLHSGISGEIPSLHRAIGQLAIAANDARSMQRSADDQSKYARLSGNPMKYSTLEHWKYEEARDGGSTWLMWVSSDKLQKLVAPRFSGLASVVYKTEDVMSKNINLPIRHSYRPKDYSWLENAPAVEASSSLLDYSIPGALKLGEAERLTSLIRSWYEAYLAQEHGLYRTHGTGRTCNTSEPMQLKSTSAKSGKRKQRESDKKMGSDNDDEEPPGRNKQPRVVSRSLYDRAQEFACPLSKGDVLLGMEARCRDWSSKNMDTVIRVDSQCLSGG
jgi:hypothetical protein